MLAWRLKASGMTPKTKKKPDTPSAEERRRHPRRTVGDSQVVLVLVEKGNENGQQLKAVPIDSSDGGMGLELASPLAVGALVNLRTYFPKRREFGRGYAVAEVMWCRRQGFGRYRAGIAFRTSTEAPPN